MKFYVESVLAGGKPERVDYAFPSKGSAELFRRMMERQEPGFEWRVVKVKEAVA